MSFCFEIRGRQKRRGGRMRRRRRLITLTHILSHAHPAYTRSFIQTFWLRGPISEVTTFVSLLLATPSSGAGDELAAIVRRRVASSVLRETPTYARVRSTPSQKVRRQRGQVGYFICIRTTQTNRAPCAYSIIRLMLFIQHRNLTVQLVFFYCRVQRAERGFVCVAVRRTFIDVSPRSTIFFYLFFFFVHRFRN